MKSHLLQLSTLLFVFASCSVHPEKKPEGIRFVAIKDVKINDPFWSPKLELWSKVTANDVLNKFEGKHLHDKESLFPVPIIPIRIR